MKPPSSALQKWLLTWRSKLKSPNTAFVFIISVLLCACSSERYIFADGIPPLRTERFSPLKASSGSTGAVEQTAAGIPVIFGQRSGSGTDPEDRDTDGSPVRTVEPSTAMYHSLMLPGWGQLDNGKKKKAAMFITAEIVCIGGYIYMNRELNTGGHSEFEKENLRTDRNSFVLYWMISKVFGLLDAYVDAHLSTYDVEDITPEELK
jgi:hypothetical protein